MIGKKNLRLSLKAVVYIPVSLGQLIKLAYLGTTDIFEQKQNNRKMSRNRIPGHP